MIAIINCYIPHSELTKKKQEDAEKFYDNLDKLVNKYKNKSSIVLAAGDMNAAVGRKTNETCIGKYSKGYKYDNGNYLINFCQNNELLLTDTCFKHKQSHSTTWQRTHLNKEKNKTQKIRKVLDFTMIENQYKRILLNARSCSGTYTITY